MEDLTVRTFDFKDYIVTWGAIVFSGEAEEGITVTYPEDAFTKNRGAGLSVERINTGSLDTEVEINLLQTNPLNTAMSALFVADVKTNKGALPLSIVDTQGQTVVFSTYAWIKKMPDLAVTKEGAPKMWAMDTGNASSVVGGKEEGSSIFG